jgi:hypothetical protein
MSSVVHHGEPPEKTFIPVSELEIFFREMGIKLQKESQTGNSDRG